MAVHLTTRGVPEHTMPSDADSAAGYVPEGRVDTLGFKMKALLQRTDEIPGCYWIRCLQTFFTYLAADSSFFSALTTGERAILGLVKEWYLKQQGRQMSSVKRRLLAVALGDYWDITQDFQLDKLEGLIPPSELNNLHALRMEVDETRDQVGSLYQEVQQLTSDGCDKRTLQDRISGRREYDTALLTLLFAEFDGTPWSPDTIWRVRYRAVMVAAAERTGRNCLHHIQTRFGSTQSDQKINSSSGAGIQLRDCRIILPSIWEPCQWLSEAQGQNKPINRLPHYLWDIERECTVETESLHETDICYGIVSHTWGRWRKEGDGVNLKGVRDWLVPENARFNVTDLPRILKRAGFPEDYVWLDLLCIPQDTSDERLARICQEELARQATIFMHASTSIAWLNDVSSWHDTELTISWIGLNYLRASHSNIGSDNHDRTPEEITTALNTLELSMPTSCGLLTYAVSESGYIETRVPGWFSSLWTLQESMMRPDMLFVNDKWEPLCVGEDNLVTVASMISLITMHTRVTNTSKRGQDVPPCFHELYRLMAETGYLSLHRAERLTPLILARNRECTNSRATAIMSVTGATAWHLGRKVEQFQAEAKGEKEDLVCGLYPFEFINELRLKVGGSFFTYNHSVSTLITTDGDEAVKALLRGTMLPFMPGYEGNIITDGISVARHYDHPSVEGWQIQMDGSIKLHTVGIVASSCQDLQVLQKPQHYHSVMIMGNDPLDSKSVTTVSSTNKDLLGWLRSFKGEAHAICTMVSRSSEAGVILHRLKAGLGPFVKAGIFLLHEDDEPVEQKFPMTVDVNWHVL